MEKAPSIIHLQCEESKFDDQEGITWSENQINKSDIKYWRDSYIKIMERAYQKENTELKARIKELEKGFKNQQRELLIAYCKYILDECTADDKITIDAFLKQFN